MILRCALLMFLFNLATTYEYLHKDSIRSSADLDSIFSLWPSVHNAARIMKLRKRETRGQVGQNEGGGNDIQIQKSAAEHVAEAVPVKPLNTHPANDQNSTNIISNPEPAKANVTSTNEPPKTIIDFNLTAPAQNTETKGDETSSSKLDINNPGVLKRGLIVFGGFALMAVAYFVFYRRNLKKNDASNLHNTNETNQFRYGVLQSDDRRENMELSRIPLTMDSDEDDDEDLEIFDLGQKKKSLSYVNLQTHDDEAVNNSIDIDKDDDNLLLDIEDASSDTLINWSNNGNKSIL